MEEHRVNGAADFHLQALGASDIKAVAAACQGVSCSHLITRARVLIRLKLAALSSSVQILVFRSFIWIRGVSEEGSTP